MLSNIADDLHPPNRASLPSHWRIKCEPSVEIVNLGQCDVTYGFTICRAASCSKSKGKDCLIIVTGLVLKRDRPFFVILKFK
jgi:hypothetical protein